jgi:hypothetical protein
MAGRPVLSVFPGAVEWTAADADLSKAVVFTLGSGSKTCRAFVQQLATNRDPKRGPIGLVEVTGSGSSIADMDLHFKHKVIGYDAPASEETLQWLAALGTRPSRIVVIDCGGPGSTAKDLVETLRDTQSKTKVELVVVGSEVKVFTMQELQAKAAQRAEHKAIQLNTSPIIFALAKEIGHYATHDELINEWRKVVKSEMSRNEGTERGGKVLGLQLDVRQGVRGNDGLEGAWREMCEGRVKRNTACVIAL